MQDKAAIAFGGSYGGMLASWMRMKFPNVVQGALAASAPILQFQGAATEEEYYKITENDFAQTYNDSRCSLGLNEGFNYLMDLKNRTDDWAELSTLLNTCETINSTDMIDNLYQHYKAGFEYMAMTDYPYPGDFL